MKSPEQQNHNPPTAPTPYGKIEEIVWDGDNTIWDWVSYAVPAYEAMCTVIAEETGKTEDEVTAAMKRFYSLVGTLEHEGLIQGLKNEGFFRGTAIDTEDLILKVQQAFSQKRNLNLHTYPGIQKVFKAVHETGIKNTILTDAPSFQAKMRIKRSQLHLLIDHLNAMPAANIPNLPQKYKEKRENGKYSVDFQITEIPEEKPHSNLELILKRTRESIRQHVVIIGDNDKKDMELARIYGCRAIYAAYGIAKKELLERLKRFAPEKVAGRNLASTAAPQHSETGKATSAAQIITAEKSTDVISILEKLL